MVSARSLASLTFATGDSNSLLGCNRVRSGARTNDKA